MLSNLNGNFILDLGYTLEHYETITTEEGTEELKLKVEDFVIKGVEPELWQILVDGEEVKLLKLNTVESLSKYRELSAGIEITNNYASNYIVDQTYFAEKSGGQGLGRGYDSTVWQKVIKEGKATYVMIAELNSVVPTFDIAPIAPGKNGVVIPPQWSPETSNLYYKLLMQPS